MQALYNERRIPFEYSAISQKASRQAADYDHLEAGLRAQAAIFHKGVAKIRENGWHLTRAQPRTAFGRGPKAKRFVGQSQAREKRWLALHYPKWLKCLFLMPAMICAILALSQKNWAEIGWLVALFGIIGGLFFRYLHQNEQRYERGNYSLFFHTRLTQEQCVASLQSKQIQDTLIYEFGYDESKDVWWIDFEPRQHGYSVKWSRYDLIREKGHGGTDFELVSDFALFGVGNLFLLPARIENFFKQKLNAVPCAPHRTPPPKPVKRNQQQ